MKKLKARWVLNVGLSMTYFDLSLISFVVEERKRKKKKKMAIRDTKRHSNVSFIIFRFYYTYSYSRTGPYMDHFQYQHYILSPSNHLYT
jgi:hypothetical protein